MFLKKENIIIFVILVMAFYGLSLRINKPFVGIHDWNGAYYGNISRNYLRLGLVKTKLGQVINDNGKKLQYSNHYTPLLALYLSSFAKLFGLTESTLRFAIVGTSLLMLLYIYKIGSLINKKVGLFSALLISLTPIFLYYGKLPDHDPLVVSLGAITVYYFLTNKKKRFLLFYILSLLESWPAFFLLPGFLGVSIFWRKKRFALNGKKLIFITFLTFAATFAYAAFLSGSLTSLISVFMFRANVSGNNLYSFSLKNFILQVGRYHAIYFTRIMMLIAVFGSFILFLERKKFKTLFYGLLIFFLYAFGFMMIFTNLYWVHDYKIMHLIPFVALVSGFFFWKFSSALLQKKLPRPMVFLFTLVLTAAIFLERKTYFQTIINSANAREAYEIGKYLNKNSEFSEEIIILPEVFGRANDVFVAYYSDRQVAYQANLNYALNIRPDFIILASSYDEKDKIKNKLINYQLIKEGDFHIYENNNSN